MRASIYRRDTCRLCESKNIELVVELEPIPLSENYCKSSEDGKQSERYSVDLYMCIDCGHVQQIDVVDSKSLWENYTYHSSDAIGMIPHFHEVANQVINNFNPKKNSLVVDIGSNDGALLKEFKRAGYRVLGVDPAIEIARNATKNGIETIPELMSIQLANHILTNYGEADVICIFNAFAHADNMGEIARSIRTILSPDGVCIFEAQYLMDIIERMLIATIFHEHMSHHSVKALTIFLDKYDLELIDVGRNSIQHGSILGVVQIKGGLRPINDSVINLIQLEREKGLDQISTLKDFSGRIQRQKKMTQRFVRYLVDTGSSLAGYGAARSGPTLIAQLGLDNSIDYIVDDHPEKIGKFTSGHGIPIFKTDQLLKRMPDYVVVLAWVHSEKIIAKNQEYLERGGKFIILCPQTRIVTKDGDVNIETFFK